MSIFEGDDFVLLHRRTEETRRLDWHRQTNRLDASLAGFTVHPPLDERIRVAILLILRELGSATIAWAGIEANRFGHLATGTPAVDRRLPVIYIFVLRVAFP